MKKEMENFEVEFAKAMSSETLPMEQVLRYVSGAKGKRLRPRLVFLSASLFGEVNDTTRRTALFVELLHTATLIHDDVVDGSDMRRGQPSVNGRWDNKTAVLAGDYLLSKAMLQLADPKDGPILNEMLGTAMAMSEGELMQLGSERLEVRGEGEATQKYIDIITRKTARLIRACCVGGAMSVMYEKTEDGRQKLELISEFGLNLGLVFQMRDDILDADQAEHVVLAERLMPRYLGQAQSALEALSASISNREALASLRDLVAFCAERSQ
jgi:octaprenyl-diphosphate synthase